MVKVYNLPTIIIKSKTLLKYGNVHKLYVKGIGKEGINVDGFAYVLSARILTDKNVKKIYFN